VRTLPRGTGFDFAIGAALGATFFVAAFGVRLLDPRYIDWLLWGDPAANYLGWAFFRNDPWGFPLAQVRSYGEGFASSIVFSDSIPWLAIVFKALRGLLSEPFQYFGLWIATSFTLQGGVGFVLARKLGADRIAAALIAGLLLISPPLLNRLTGHYALTAQWVLLAALGLCLFGRTVRRFYGWMALIAMLVATQFYLAVMVMALWFADLVKAWLHREADRRALAAFFGATLAVTLGVMAACGYFLVDRAGTGADMVGFYRLNAVSLVNSEGLWSRVLPKIPAGFGDYEGFAYLGLGWMAATLLAIARARRVEPAPAHTQALVPLAIVLFLLTVFAISMWPAIGKQIIFAAPENIAVAVAGLAVGVYLIVRFSSPGSPWRLRVAQAAAKQLGVFWVLALVAAFLFAIATAPLVAFMLTRVPGAGTIIETFRASGRMFWPAWYALVLWAAWVIVRTFAPRPQYLVLAIVLALQLWDLSGAIDLLGRTTVSPRMNFATDPDNPLRSPQWNELMHDRKRLLVLHPDPKPHGWEAFGKLAVEHHAALNKAYFSRERAQAYAAANAALWTDIEAGRFDDDALYVAYPDERARLEAALAALPAAPPTLVVDKFLVIAPRR
jgi:hypothetical protein